MKDSPGGHVATDELGPLSTEEGGSQEDARKQTPSPSLLSANDHTPACSC